MASSLVVAGQLGASRPAPPAVTPAAGRRRGLVIAAALVLCATAAAGRAWVARYLALDLALVARLAGFLPRAPCARPWRARRRS